MIGGMFRFHMNIDFLVGYTLGWLVSGLARAIRQHRNRNRKL